jgi:hypothetical protein
MAMQQAPFVPLSSLVCVVVSGIKSLIFLPANDNYVTLIVMPMRACELSLTRRDKDDEEQNNDADDEAHSHLHVFPPHLLAHTVGAPSEALGGGGEVIGLVLQRI